MSIPRALDEATDVLEERFPETVAGTKHLVELRGSLDDFTWFGAEKIYGHGSADMKAVASIPKDLFLLLIQVEPNFVTDKSIFFRWLSRHPRFRRTRKVPRA